MAESLLQGPDDEWSDLLYKRSIILDKSEVRQFPALQDECSDDEYFSMEESLNQGFAKLEDPAQINAGLRELDGLLMDLFSLLTDMVGRVSGDLSTHEDKVRQFLALQDNPKFDMASRLLAHTQCMLRDPGNNIKRTTRGLEIIQGCCHLHRPSRRIFSTLPAMGTLIECLKLDMPDKIQVAAIRTIASCMECEVANVRLFEKLDGIATMCKLYNEKDTPKRVRNCIVAFLLFYLVSETANARVAVGSEVQRKTTSEKADMLGKYLHGVDVLVRDLRRRKPFGSMSHEW